MFSEYVNPITSAWKEPEHKYNGRRPSIACFIDDAQSTAIFRNRKFINLAIKHRHLFSMPEEEASLGLSLFIAVQSYTSTGGGSVPKSVRNQVTALALWRTKNMKELQLISEEMGGQVAPEKFQEVYNFVMQDAIVISDIHI